MKKKLDFSDKLRKMLENMDSNIAKKLLEHEVDTDDKDHIDYLDIAKDDASKISYLTKPRYEAILNREPINITELKKGDTFICIDATKYGYDENGLAWVVGCTCTVVETATFISDSLRARVADGYSFYFRAIDIDKCVKYGVYDNKDIRYMASCGKVVQKILGPQDGKELATFCQHFQAFHPDFNLPIEYDLVFVKGDDIRKYYLEDNYVKLSGHLGGSCMRYKQCQNFLDLYVLNEDLIQLFIVKEQGKDLIAGRCLIWDNKYFDRVYGIDDNIQAKVIKYLTSLGFEDAWENENTITFDIKYGYSEFNLFPYCDTFRYLSNTKISNSCGINYDICLDCAGGNNDSYVVCEISEERISSDDAICINNCYYHPRYCSWSNYDDEYYLEEDVVFSECLQDYIYVGCAIELYNRDWCHENEVVKLSNGDYAWKGDKLLEEVESEYTIR